MARRGGERVAAPRPVQGMSLRGQDPDGMEKGDPILYPYGNGAAELGVFRGWLCNSLLMSIRAAFGLPDDGQGMGDHDQNYQNQFSVSDGRKPLPCLT